MQCRKPRANKSLRRWLDRLSVLVFFGEDERRRLHFSTQRMLASCIRSVVADRLKIMITWHSKVQV